MTISYWDRTPNFGVAFAIHKIQKLYPLHIITMLGMIPLRVYYGVKLNIIALQLLLHASLFQIWLPIPELYSSLNGVAWYLSASLFLYFCFPAILAMLKQMHAKKTIFCLLGVLVLQIGIAIIACKVGNLDKNTIFSMQWITYYCPLTRLFDFVAGCCLAVLFMSIIKVQRSALFDLLGVITIGLIIVSLWIYKMQYEILGSEYVRYTLLFAPSTLLLVFFVAINQGHIAKSFSNRVLVSIGNYSAFGFLIHFPVIRYCQLILGHFKLSNPLFVFVLSIVLTAVGIKIWLWIETSILKKTQKRGKSA